MPRLLTSLRQLIQHQLDERGIVVWYDPEGDYAHAVDRLAPENAEILKEEEGYFALREKLETWLEWLDQEGRPIPDHEVPPRVVVYVPRERTDNQYVLIETETAGVVIEPGAPVSERNTRLATLVERVYTKVSPEKAGHVARQVEEGLLSFEDVEQMAEEAGSEATGALKLIFGQASPVDVILAFVASEENDPQIASKKAVGELASLIESEIGWECDATKSAGDVRQGLVRQLLLGEVAMALPEAMREGTLAAIDLPGKAVQHDTIKHLCHRWRNRLDLQDAYGMAAMEVEASAGLGKLDPPTEQIETLETFAAVDVLLMQRASQALLDGDASVAGQWAEQRRGTFWVRRAPELLLQWSLIEVAADLLAECATISTALRKRKWVLDDLIAAYTTHASPWMRVDTLARHLESRYARFDFQLDDDSPDWEPVMAKCRSAYLGGLDQMAMAYTSALEAAEFQSAQAPDQGQIFRDEVKLLLSAEKKTAYLLVDALRFEMAAELVEGMKDDFAIDLRSALGQLPGITPVGMALLMPGAEDGLELEKHAGGLQVSLGGERITERAARMAWLKEKVGNEPLVLKLGEIVRLTPKKKKTLTEATFIVVTSQEIDRLGEVESEDDEARIYMDDVLEKLRRGIRNLAATGVTDIIISADHGFIFAEGFEEGLKMDPPGGETVELHPRCWIGQGGTTGEGYFRVSASSLELGGPLECAFPRGLGTFKVRGGAGAYFHGGASLQEQVLPVLHLVRKAADRGKGAVAKIVIGFPKKQITNRFFSVTLSLESEEMFEPEPTLIRAELKTGRDVVGQAAMSAYGFEEGTCEVLIKPGKPNSVTMMLTREIGPEKLSLQIVNTKNEAVLGTMKDITVNLAL